MIDKIFRWYFRRASLPYWCILLIDSILFLLSGVAVYYLFHKGSKTLANIRPLTNIMLVYLAITIVFYKMYHVYVGIMRYSSFIDLMRVGKANMLSMIVVFFIHYWVYKWPMSHFAHLNTREIFSIYVLATALMCGVRVLVKLFYDFTTSDKRAMKALIYGISDGGVGIAKNIRQQKPTKFLLRGFISHDQKYEHHQLMGVNVYLGIDETLKAVRKYHIEAVLVSPLRNDEFRKNQPLQDMLISENVKMYMVSNATEWKGKESSDYIHLHEVQVEDLLPRDEIKVDMKQIAEQLKGKRVLVTGSAGSIGSEMVRQIAFCAPEAMVLIDQAETPQHDMRLMIDEKWPMLKVETIVTSICRHERMEEIFSTFKPDYVFHAAAYKHVPMMENNPREAVLNNVVGTMILADLSVKYGVRKFVMVSTDKAVNPTNVMGCSKRICEMYAQSLNTAQNTTQFITTRFGNVLGSNGSVIPHFREQIKNGGPVTVTHPDIIRFFMLIPEACQLVLEAGTKGHGGEIFVFDMGAPVRIADLARKMIKLSGVEGVEIKYTGLRPGEKLYEEVLDSQENSLSSFHDKIHIAKVRQYNFAVVSKSIRDLVDLAKKEDDMTVVAKMKEIVPEYKSNNSKFDVLDKAFRKKENPLVFDGKRHQSDAIDELHNLNVEL